MPGLKRDLASKKASGDILAFLDDDAQPSVDWLNIANHFFMTKMKRLLAVQVLTQTGMVKILFKI